MNDLEVLQGIGALLVAVFACVLVVFVILLPFYVYAIYQNTKKTREVAEWMGKTAVPEIVHQLKQINEHLLNINAQTIRAPGKPPTL